MSTPRKPVPRPPTAADLRRWFRRARSVFSTRRMCGGDAQARLDLEHANATELARDVLRVLDRGGRRRPR